MGIQASEAPGESLPRRDLNPATIFVLLDTGPTPRSLIYACLGQAPKTWPYLFSLAHEVAQSILVPCSKQRIPNTHFTLGSCCPSPGHWPHLPLRHGQLPSSFKVQVESFISKRPPTPTTPHRPPPLCLTPLPGQWFSSCLGHQNRQEAV